MRRRGRRLETAIDRIMRQVALVADREVVLSTPVDTGRARSNWIVSIGNRDTTEREPFVHLTFGTQSESQNAQGAINQGMQAIAAHKSGKNIYIQNNLPYIGELNDGSSKQAPKQFVQKAVIIAGKIVRNANKVTD